MRRSRSSGGRPTCCRFPNTSSPWPRRKRPPAGPRMPPAASSSPVPRSSSSRPAGVAVDLDLALVEADHGDPARALCVRRGSFQGEPTVRAADALAWALHRWSRPPTRSAPFRRCASSRARATRCCVTTRAPSPPRSVTWPARAGSWTWPSPPTRVSRPLASWRPVASWLPPRIDASALLRRVIHPARMLRIRDDSTGWWSRPVQLHRPIQVPEGFEDLPHPDSGRIFRVHSFPGPSALPAPSSSRRRRSAAVFASSHREAPLIRGRPLRGQHGPVRVRQSRTIPTASRSSPTTFPSRNRRAARTSSCSTRPCATRSTSTTTATASPTSPTRSASRRITSTNSGTDVPLQRRARSTSLTDPNLLVRQTYDVWRSPWQPLIASNVKTPPVNIGPRSTPSYEALAATAVSRRSAQRDQALRRPARRRVLRRPRVDLRPGRPATVQHAP